MYTHFFIIKSTIGINSYTLTPYKNHHKNKYIYIYTIYTQNYALKYTIKYITITYIPKSLKLLLFFKNIKYIYIYFFVLV